jgi:hypothetical protein
VPVRPAFKRCSCGQEIMRAGQYCGDCMLGSGPGDKGVKPLDARIAQAKKQLGAGIGGPRYPYAESSVIWSNPSSESDP